MQRWSAWSSAPRFCALRAIGIGGRDPCPYLKSRRHRHRRHSLDDRRLQFAAGTFGQGYRFRSKRNHVGADPLLHFLRHLPPRRRHGGEDADTKMLELTCHTHVIAEGRLVYLSAKAKDTLGKWRLQFPDAKPNHFVFPSERYALKGKKGTFGGTVSPYKTFPDRAISSFAK